MFRIIFTVITCILLFVTFVLVKGLVYRPCRDITEVFSVEWSLPSDTIIKALVQKVSRKAHYRQSKLTANELPRDVIDHYMSDELLDRVAETTGMRFAFSDERDPDRIFVKLYSQENDGIRWHYDNNYTKGRRYTLVFLLHRSECSTAQLQFRDCATNTVYSVHEEEVDGRGILFDASYVFHRVTPQKLGCQRMSVIIPLFEDPRYHIFGRLGFYFHKLGNRIFRL